MDSPVIFLHIPKTAGTTLLSILNRQYPPEAIHSFGADAHASVAEFKALDEETRSKVRLLRGHMAFGLHEYLPGNVKYFTVLREPVARVISYYNFILRTPDHYLYDYVVGQGMNLHELLESGLPLMMNDGAVRLLSGVWGDPGFGEVTSAMGRTAQQNLDNHFIASGITEEFDRTLLLLKDKLGWRGDITYQRKNVSVQGLTAGSLPAETVELIRRSNCLDIALYDYAREWFHEQCRRQGPLFALRLRLFQWRNR